LDGLAAGCPRRGTLQARADDLLRRNRGCWNGPLHRYLHRSGLRNLVASRRRAVRRWGYRRGFPETLCVHGAAFLEHADALLRLGPIRELRLWGVRGLGPALAASPHLPRFAALDFTNDRLRDADLFPLLVSPLLRTGVLLRLRGNSLSPRGADTARDWER